MKTKHDIVVVGAGPCGSYAAYSAAKLGANVVVCEEHNQVGAPDHCAGHLNISSLKRLQIPLPQSIIENEIKGANIYSPSGKEFVLRCHNPVTYVVDRGRFDKHIAELAMKAGVQYRFKSRVKSLLFDSGHVKGVILKEKEKIESSLVIDAEGCSSAILKNTGLAGLRASMTVRGIQADVEGLEHFDEDMVEVYLGRNVAPDFFAWIIPRKDGTAKVGLATSTGNPQQHLRSFMEKHPVASKKLQKSKVNSILAHPIPLAGPIPKTYSNGFLAVGDAASQVKPTTGGGVIFGLTCAKVAGEVACEAVKSGNFSEMFLSSYHRQWKRLVGFDLSAMLMMRRMLNSLPDSRTDKVIDLCKRLGISETLKKFGDIDFQGRSLIPMMKYPGTLAVISYFLYSWLMSSTKQSFF
ncbi:MAG: NAD(P)/FAD-dependent oxidoreductase [Candidatus Bathyarchaeota archaeon]|nr:NAD(P)/FAD-dependent oxidoreductase [Candidatus Bathyarchaeum sp.]